LTTVDYDFEFSYTALHIGSFPMLALRITSLRDPQQALDVDAFIDSGTGSSLFSGEIAASIGLDLLAGPRKTYVPIRGPRLAASVHRVRLSHELLGDFDLEVGFSLEPITRNLLGRDFFDLIQIGFREHQLVFLVKPTP
jgi:hypothetical protein